MLALFASLRSKWGSTESHPTCAENSPTQLTGSVQCLGSLQKIAMKPTYRIIHEGTE